MMVYNVLLVVMSAQGLPSLSLPLEVPTALEMALEMMVYILCFLYTNVLLVVLGVVSIQGSEGLPSLSLSKQSSV